MKFKKLGTAVLATAAVFALAACGNDSKESSNGDSDKIVTSIDKDTTVTFWHAMNGAQEEALTKITEDFMKENPKIKIELQNQSQYPDLQAKSTQHYLLQRIYQQSAKHIQAGYGMQHKMIC